MQQEAQKSGLFIFTDVDLKFDTPQIEFKVDASKANRLGINMADIGGSLATLLGGNYVNRFNLYGRSYEVIPQVPRDFRLTEDWLTQYRVRTASRCSGILPLILRSISKSMSIRRTASLAIGASPCFTRSTNFLRPWLQQAASRIGAGFLCAL